MRAIFRGLCPNCGGEITDDRLLKKLPCEKCLPEEVNIQDYHLLLETIYDILKKNGKLKKYKELYEEYKKVKDFEEFFISKMGNRLWSAQRTWAKRILKGESFTIIAPTGVGKTVFACAMAVYLAKKYKKRSYIIVPTTTLLDQVKERVEFFGGDPIVYKSKMKRKEREEFYDRLENEDFYILITTSAFLSRNFNLLRHIKFDFIFIDDVDAFLKASKNIDRVLILLGFTEEDLEIAWKILELKNRIALELRRGREKEARRIYEEIERLKKKISKGEKGQIVVSSATGRARGRRVKLFRELKEFEIGSIGGGIRNIEDFYIVAEDLIDAYKKVLDVVRLMGTGGLIFVAKDLGVETAVDLARFLQARGIKCDVVTSETGKKGLQKFIDYEVDVLIGVAHYYGLLVRGLDLPERVRYTVFLEVPRFKVGVYEALDNPYMLLYMLREVAEILEDENAERLFMKLTKLLRSATRYTLILIRRYYAGELEKLEGLAEQIVEVCKEGKEYLMKILEDREKAAKIAEKARMFVMRDGYVLFPDVATYIQASGRCSRMFAGGMTKGISVVVTTEEKLLRALERKMGWRYSGFSFKEYNPDAIREVLKEVDRDREFVKLIREGKIEKTGFEEPLKSVLFIVESPNKARTIASFFGRPSVRRRGNIRIYEVTTGKYLLSIVATKGHIFDLVTDRGLYGVENINGKWIPIYSFIKKCRKCGEQFIDEERCPACGSDDIVSSEDTVNVLRELASEVDLVLIATDPDQEGEKIAWDVFCAISPYTVNIRRAEFHEVTERAILQALESPREIDIKFVEAQIVRRVEDRWIGFALSELLQRVFKRRNLSAGRVQSPVLKWVIERYDSRKADLHAFIFATLENGLTAVFEDESVRSAKEIEELYKKLSGKKAKVRIIGEEVREVNPLPPFDTSAMILEASNVFGWTATKTMQIAQELFELGLCTYHRTDSIRVSPEGMALARRYIEENIGEGLYKGRVWGTGGAHECIRPTRPIDIDNLMELINMGLLQAQLTKDHLKLYDLIFRRFIASQMVPAVVKFCKIEVTLDKYRFEDEIPVEILQPGFLKIYPIWREIIPVKEGEYEIKALKIRLDSKIKLYTEGSLVDEMRRRKIGRPSTYSTIISKLKKRVYIIEKYYLIPTRRGRMVCRFLFSKFPDLVGEERTRELEEKIDLISEGKVSYMDCIHELYRELEQHGLLPSQH